MKIFAICPLYDDVRWLSAALEGVYSELDRIYLVVSDKPWHGSPRRPGAVMRAMRTIVALPDPDGKIEVLHDIWPDEHTTRNEIMRICHEEGADYAMMLDSDEIWDPVDLRCVRTSIEESPEVQYWYVWWSVYWKTRFHRLEPRLIGQPLVFVKLDGETRIDWLRSPPAVGRRQTIDPAIAVLHHLSYVRTDEEMQAKFKLIRAVGGPADWYDRVWKGWDKDNTLRNLHPIDPPDFQCTTLVTVDDLPPALR